MTKQTNLYLFTQDCQRLFSQQPAYSRGIYRRVEHKLIQIHHKVLNDNLTAVVQANIVYQRLTHYITDLQSEIKKYESIINNSVAIISTQQTLKSACFPFHQPNRLTRLFNEACLLTDRLIVLLMTALRCNRFEERGTFFHVKTYLMKKFYGVLGKINTLSVKTFPELKAKDYLQSPDIDGNRDFTKTKAILKIGFIPHYKQCGETS